MANGKSYIFELKCVKTDLGTYRMPFFIHYKVEKADEENINGVIVREVVLKVFNADVKAVEPVEPYQPPKPIFKKLRFGNSVIQGKLLNFLMRSHKLALHLACASLSLRFT